MDSRGLTKDEMGKTGLFYNWAFERYLTSPGINQSWLTAALDKSPKQAEMKRSHPRDTQEFFVMGHLFEGMIEWPNEAWQNYFFEVPNLDKMTTAAERKEAVLLLDKLVPGTRNQTCKSFHEVYELTMKLTKKKLVTGGMVRACKAMVKRCAELPLIDELLFSAYADYQVTMVTHLQGVLTKGRADIVIPVQNLSPFFRERLVGMAPGLADESALVLVDVKTARDASPTSIGFRKQATAHDYFLQVAFYSKLLNKLAGVPVVPFIVAVEKPDLAMLEEYGHSAVEAVLYPIGSKTLAMAEDRIERSLEMASKAVKYGLGGYPEVTELVPLTYYGS